LKLPVNFGKTATMEEQSQEEQCLRKAEEYVKEHDIQRIVKDCIVQLCIHRPDNPYSFLRQHFASLEKVYMNVKCKTLVWNNYLNSIPVLYVMTHSIYCI